MTHSSALDIAIRQAHHLLFAFDGPIRSTGIDGLADANASTTPYIHEVLTACNESGRSVVVISPKQRIDVPAYLDAHDLFSPITLIAASVRDGIKFLEAVPTRCLLITSSTADIKAARAAKAPSIGYARTPDAAADLVDAGATGFVYSMADIALTLRAHRLDP
jgi:beta-phosphoglucomutase-like phosphatase (HAD superfamily)